MTAPPMAFKWDGESMFPVGRFARECDRHFVVGETYRLVEHQDRSRASHDHFFAAIHDAWENLPEHIAARIPTPDHLRKFALIRTGYADQRQLVASSKAEARRLAAFVRPMDEYAIVSVEGCVVTVFTAQSQSMKAMGKSRFQASKQAVLDWVANLIGTTPAALSENVRSAA